MSSYRSRIAGIGGYVPSRVVTNQDLEKFIDTSDEWITQRSGIKQRHWAEAHEINADLAKNASLIALEKAGLKKEDIDCIVFATINPDYFFPGNGCNLQEKLEIYGIPAIDIRQQCTGFIYALSIADQYVRTGMYKNILVIGSEIHSRGLDKTTRGRDVTVLFGDGAGAVVVTRCEPNDLKKDSYVYSTHLHTDGRGARLLWVPAPGVGIGNAEERITAAMLEQGDHYPKMEGKKVFVEAVSKMGETLLEAVKFNGLKMEDIDMFFFHQANLRINEAVADYFKIPREKIYNTIHKYGNTTAATIPLGMHDAVVAGRLKPGMLVAVAAFGSGFTWGSSVFRL